MHADQTNFYFVVPVWGKSYTTLFVEVCLPMLLTTGNLGVFKDRQEFKDKFLIVTTYQDKKLIELSESYSELRQIIEVEFLLIDGLVDMNNPHEAMSRCYSMAIQRECVIPGKTYFIFLTPDSFWSEGTFKALLGLAEKGTAVVMAIGFRVNAEAVSKILREDRYRYIKSAENNFDLVQLVINHIHQLSSAHDWLTTKFLNLWPSHIYWIDHENSELIAHCFHLHPLMVLAPKKKIKIGTTIDGEFLGNLSYPLSRYYVSQGEFFGVELSPSARAWGQKLSYPYVKNIDKFAIKHVNSRHWFFFSHRICLRANEGKSIDADLDKLICLVVDKTLSKKTRLLLMYHARSFFYSILLKLYVIQGLKVLKRKINTFLSQYAKN